MQTTQEQQAVAPPQLGRYEIDTKRSTVTFRTRHLSGLAPVRGIDRTEFGVTASRGLAGRYLDLVLDVRGVRR